MAIVYLHKRKDTNEIFYVGKGKNYLRAYSKHGRNKYWENIVNKYGYDIEIIYENISNEESILLEKKLIKEYGRIDLGTGILVNMTDGGDGASNSSPSDETRAKMSASQKGKIISEEQRKSVSKVHKNKIVSEESRLKISLAKKGISSPFKGQPLSAEHIKKLSISHIGKKLSKESIKKRTQSVNKKIIQLDKNNTIIKKWNSIKEAKEITKISTIPHCLIGRIKTAGGFQWRYQCY